MDPSVGHGSRGRSNRQQAEATWCPIGDEFVCGRPARCCSNWLVSKNVKTSSGGAVGASKQ